VPVSDRTVRIKVSEMKKVVSIFLSGTLLLGSLNAFAQVDSADVTVLSLEQALQIALSENVSVKIADKEIEHSGYAKKGTYAALYPQISGTGSYQYTWQKQTMYMDVPGMEDGREIGKTNNFSFGAGLNMPVVNAQLWETLKISDLDVELAVEKARSSRLDMVNQVKQCYFAVLLAKESYNVYKSVYENAVDNFNQTELKYNSGRASELDMARARTSVANAIPNTYDSESAIVIALWQLKAVMGISLDTNIDVDGSLNDYGGEMLVILQDAEKYNLDMNSNMKQLAIQVEELSSMVKSKQYAYIPTLSLTFSYSYSAMDDFSNYRWSPYSYLGVSLNIPIFSGMKRLNDVRQAQVKASELNLQMADTERQLQISIRQYINKMETSFKSYESAVVAEESAQKSYDITSRSYSVGRSTFTDLSGAQLALTQAKLSVCQAIYSYMVARANLENTIGFNLSE